MCSALHSSRTECTPTESREYLVRRKVQHGVVERSPGRTSRQNLFGTQWSGLATAGSRYIPSSVFTPVDESDLIVSDEPVIDVSSTRDTSSAIGYADQSSMGKRLHRIQLLWRTILRGETALKFLRGRAAYNTLTTTSDTPNTFFQTA